MATKLLDIETLTSEELAHVAGLRYVTDSEAGILRQVNGSGFCYLNGHGLKLRDKQKLKRIETLAILPAWKEVWICKHAEGHLQVTGRDDRGRKQYIFHERWSELSNLAKFWRLRHSIRFLPVMRKQVQRDLRRGGLPRERVLAGMIALLNLTLIRVGNEEYVRQNNSLAEELGNTATVCRKYYVHAGLVDAYMKGSFQATMSRYKPSRRKAVTAGEQILARFLRQWPANL